MSITCDLESKNVTCDLESKNVPINNAFRPLCSLFIIFVECIQLFKVNAIKTKSLLQTFRHQFTFEKLKEIVYLEESILQTIFKIEKQKL